MDKKIFFIILFLALLIAVSATPSNSEEETDVLDFLPAILAAGLNNKDNPPNAPLELSVNNLSPSSLTLNWTDNSNNETGFSIYMATSQFGTYLYVESVSANTTIYSVSGLAPSITYWFKVTAYNTYGESNYSNTVSGTTLSAITTTSTTTTTTTTTSTTTTTEPVGTTTTTTTSIPLPSVGVFDTSQWDS